MRVKSDNTIPASALTNPDSLILIHIAFLAFDIFTYSHTVGAAATDPRPPGFGPSTNLAADTTAMTGIAEKLIDDVLKEAGVRLGDDDYADVGKRSALIVQEL